MIKTLAVLVTLLFALSACLHIPQKPDYKEALRLSLLFYEAQRSGYLPKTNRIKWRGDSALNDRGLQGEDLTGGYYDASDYVKFSFTMAFTTTLLAWGLSTFEDAYKEADQYRECLDAIKWASDYFVKCHVSPYELYGQVGDFTIDHRFWGRPEDMNMTRPAYKIDMEHPGSDLAAEVAAALAATSLVFEDVNKTYSDETLKHAEQLYEFAIKYPGLYQDSILGAQMYYRSPGFEDELTWAALWLFKATRNHKYLERAEQFYKTFGLDERPTEFFYNKKDAGIQVLLAQETRKAEYVSLVGDFCDFAVYEEMRTPKGLLYRDKVGTLSHAANDAFICLQAANMHMSTSTYLHFAKTQLDYMLGLTGQSFVVGYGHNYPKKPHHASSSCPNVPEPCGWSRYYASTDNPQILYGALVSGPDSNDRYEDRRDEFLYNEVTLDYNAGFQGVVAGIIYFQDFTLSNV